MDERERLLDRVLVTLEPKGPTDRPIEVLPHDSQDERRATIEVKIRELARLLSRGRRDESASKRSVKAGEASKVIPDRPKDETDTRGLSP